MRGSRETTASQRAPESRELPTQSNPSDQARLQSPSGKPNPGPDSRRNLPPPLQVFLYATASLSALSWLVILFSQTLHKGALLYSTFPPFNEVGNDFKNFQYLFLDHLHTIEFFRSAGMPYLYPAPLAIFYDALFSLWGRHPHCLIVMLLFIVIAVFAAMSFFYAAMRRRGLDRWAALTICIVTTLLSFPLQYELLRCNVEVLVWIVLTLALWAYRTNKLWIAGILLGVAIACKFYPVILLGVCLRRTKYKVIPIALVSFFVVALLADFWLGPTLKIAALETQRGTRIFLRTMAEQDMATNFDHSFFGLYKAVADPFRPNLGVAFKYYLPLASGISILLYLLRIRKLPALNQILILFILSFTIPPVSYDYTLLQLYTCWALFTLYVLDRHFKGHTVPMAGCIMFWFAFAMAPHSYAVLFGHPFGAQARLLGLVALLYLFLKYPLVEPNDVFLAQVENLTEPGLASTFR